MYGLYIATAAVLLITVVQLRRQGAHAAARRPASGQTVNPRGWPARRAMPSSGAAAPSRPPC